MGTSASLELYDSDVEAELYDVRLAATEIIQIAGMRGYHTSVIVGDREYFFDSVGILEAQPFWSHSAGDGKPVGDTVITEYGRTTMGGRAMVQVLRPFFEKGSYDVFYKNCNTFSDAALHVLRKTRLPGQYNRIERLVTATNPVSISLLNKLFKALVEHSSGQTINGEVYTTNPEAQDFSVDEVIAATDRARRNEESDSEAEASESDDSEGDDDQIDARGCAPFNNFSASSSSRS
eukprot:TRINITY_DN30248_c0_g1_i1.p1 TRINITY_DN30248_c0_g1~~TRINITY_DN30248_c0_g1_i1.p1  ORF type:complete len:235 (-),score=48.68 TRINITY_DN30248_c0_g1_i1:65-769(-)